MNSKALQLPELDLKGFSRNPKTAWLLYLDRVTAWLWQDKEGSVRWTLILDDALRRASTNHPPRTAAGLKTQVQGSPEVQRRVRGRSERQIVPAAPQALRGRSRCVHQTSAGQTCTQKGSLQDSVLRRSSLLGVRLSQSRSSRLQDAQLRSRRLPLQVPPQRQLPWWWRTSQQQLARPPLWSWGVHFTKQRMRRTPRQQQHAWLAPRRPQRQGECFQDSSA
jgi:hypothetical protein